VLLLSASLHVAEVFLFALLALPQSLPALPCGALQLFQVLQTCAALAAIQHWIFVQRFLPDASLLAFADEQVEMLRVVVF
jgi:hypothetical protein